MNKMISMEAHKAIVLSEKTKAIDNLLKEIIKNSYRCSHCKFNHDGRCFFAHPCLTNDFSHWQEED